MSKSLQNLILLDHDSRFQTLDGSLAKFDALKGRNRVAFETEEGLDNSSVFTGNPRMQKMGLIVWVDREKARAMMNLPAPAGVANEHEGPLRSLQMALREVIKSGADKALLHGVDVNPLMDNLDQMFGEV